MKFINAFFSILFKPFYSILRVDPKESISGFLDKHVIFSILATAIIVAGILLIYIFVL